MYIFLAIAFVHFYLHVQKLEVSNMGGKFLSETNTILHMVKKRNLPLMQRYLFEKYPIT